DCCDGKITIILTKSISRSARNTVDSIKYIRELKSLGIGVMFEKENLWSLDSRGEFFLTICSMKLDQKGFLWYARIKIRKLIRAGRKTRVHLLAGKTPAFIVFYGDQE
ncbi:MAG: recombinase family protein, partial [Clostridia bacterium]|nr:recombinase family protein [Clostridia bacterium]